MKTFVRQITNPRPTPEELMMRELEVGKKKEDGKWKEKWEERARVDLYLFLMI
jgi:hypothetical protein